MKALSISSSAFTAQRLRMDVIAQNIANANTTKQADGTPYRRRVVTFTSKEPDSFSAVLSKHSSSKVGSGVEVSGIHEDSSPLKRVYDPQHPDADEEGYINLPNVDTTKELIDMISASRSYEANVTVFNNTKSMAMKALEIGR